MTRKTQEKIADIYYTAFHGVEHAKAVLARIDGKSSIDATQIGLTITALIEVQEKAVNAIMFDLKYGDTE